MTRLLIIAWSLSVAVSGAPDNRGKEFVLGFISHSKPNENAFLNITTSVEEDVQVRVTAPMFSEANLDETFSVRSGVVETVTISHMLRATEGNVESKAVHITASEEIIVYATYGQGIIYNFFMAFPTDVSGKDYVVPYTSTYLVVGLENSTTVYASYFLHKEQYAFNERKDKEVILHRYEIYQFQEQAMFIRSQKPFAVFQRKRCQAHVGDDTAYVSSQRLPMQTWGRKFIYFKSIGLLRTADQNLGFYSNENYNLSITRSTGSEVITNRTGWTWFVVYSLDIAPMYMESTAAGFAVKIFGYNTARGGFRGIIPEYILPSMEQYSNEYVFIVNVGSPFTNYLIIYINRQLLDGLKMDGVTISEETSTCIQVTGAGDYLCHTLIYEGVYKIYHEDPSVVFGCMLSGSSPDDAFLRLTGTMAYFIHTPVLGACLTMKCLNGGTCTNGEPASCSCALGYRGQLCEKDACTPSTCMNGGTCLENDTDVTCVCSVDFKGPLCETDIFSPGSVIVQPDEMYLGNEHCVLFRCQFFMLDGYYYIIRWYLSDSLVHETPVMSKIEAETNFLTDETIEHKTNLVDIDVQLQCEVDVYRDKNGEVLESAISEQFRSVEIENLSPVIEKGQEAAIPFRLNIPFGCSRNSEECILVIQLYDEYFTSGEVAIAVKGKRTCGLEFEKDPIDMGMKDIPFYSGKIIITTINDMAFKREKLFHLKLRMSVLGRAKRFWTTKLSPLISVTVKDIEWRKRKYCYCHNDPHMRTFDLRYYENQNVEAFTAYKDVELQIEIQTKTKPCNRNRATCSCSCTVKAGGDTFMINHCNQHKTQYLVVKDKALRVYQKGDHFYRIHLPNGMVVNVRLDPYYDGTMNLDIYPATGSTNRGEGLCGNFNDDPGDDFRQPGGSYSPDEFGFSMSWSLLANGRRFEQLQYSDNIKAQTATVTDMMYCVCPNEQSGGNGEAICTPHKGSIWDQAVPAGEKLLEMTAKSYIDPEEISLFNIAGDGHQIGKRQAFSLNYTYARELCLKEFEASLVYTLRDSYLDIDMEQTLEECIIDVRLTGDTYWAIAHVDSLLDNILMQIELDDELKESVGDEVHQRLKTTCSEVCKTNGACENGKCVCNEGYGGELCTIDLNKSPILETISPDGLCDVARGEDCSNIDVSGNGFVDGVSCRIATQQVNTGGVFGSVEETAADCTKINFNEVEVQRTNTRKRRSVSESNTVFAERIGISVSNNGVNFSEFQYITIIDTTCQNLTQDENGIENIILKFGYCYIDGTCVENGTVHDCYKCDTQVAKFSWTKVCKDSDDDLEYYFIVMIVTVCFVCLVSVAVLLKLYHRKYRQARFQASLNERSLVYNVMFDRQKIHPDNVKASETNGRTSAIPTYDTTC